MYTIKINVLENDKGSPKRIKETLFIEGRNLKIKFFDGNQNDFDGKIKGLYNYWEVNPKLNSFIMCIIGYIDSKDDYNHLIIYNNADVFLLQNGKTIDKISV